MPDGRFCSHLSVLDPAPLRPNVAGERRQRNAPANVADEPRAGPQRGGVWPPNSSGTPDKGPLAGAAERIGSRRFANGSAVHRQTRRMEPPGCTRSEQSDVCESGGSSATFAMRVAFAALICVACASCSTMERRPAPSRAAASIVLPQVAVPGVQTDHKLQQQEVTVLSSEYFKRFVCGCGMPDTPVDQREFWSVQLW